MLQNLEEVLCAFMHRERSGLHVHRTGALTGQLARCRMLLEVRHTAGGVGCSCLQIMELCKFAGAV